MTAGQNVQSLLDKMSNIYQTESKKCPPNIGQFNTQWGMSPRYILSDDYKVKNILLHIIV